MPQRIASFATEGVERALRLVERRTQRNPAGAPPGTLVIHPEARLPTIKFIGLSHDNCHEVLVEQVSDLPALMDAWTTHWIDIDGLGSEDVLRQVGAMFEIHPLALEDVAHVHQRAKAEDYERYLYYVAKMVSPADNGFVMEQVSIMIFKNTVLTFQERPGDCLEVVRDRIRRGKGKIRKGKADFLAYAIIDAMIDGYFPFLEHLGDALEDLEDEVLERPTQEQMKRVHEIRRQLLVLRRSLWPQREAINLLNRDAIDVISKDTRVYFRDCYDHTVQLVDLTENQRELSSALMELYLSQQSQKLNEVMKLLAVISTFFMPLSFIAGLYGMNFHGSPFNMPELTWTYGYFFALGLMAVTALGLFAMFRKQGWL